MRLMLSNERSAATRSGIRFATCMLLTLVAVCLTMVASAQVPSGLAAERARSEDAVLEIWPEVADPHSLMAREVERLLKFYEAQRDPRLATGTAPMWIASQAAANIERKRTAAESQQTAMRLYPELAVLDSPLNKLFRETYNRYKEVDPRYFDNPRWPIKLAQQSALFLAAQKSVSERGGSASVNAAETVGAADTGSPSTKSWLSALGSATLKATFLLAATAAAFWGCKFAVARLGRSAREDWSI